MPENSCTAFPDTVDKIEVVNSPLAYKQTTNDPLPNRVTSLDTTNASFLLLTTNDIPVVMLKCNVLRLSENMKKI